jgi:two-component system response regulator YesN
MVKVVIADDEPRVLQLIKELVDWEGLALNLVGEAEDGLAAFELIQTAQPEIVVTDIRMPGIDGLELVRRCRAIGLRTSFIIISGYKHFEYAQNALRYGVEEYLVKPIDERELNLVLDRLCRRHFEESGKRDQVRALQDQLEKSREILRQQFAHVLAFTPDQLPSASLPVMNAEYQVTLTEGCLLALAVRVDGSDIEVDDHHIHTVADKLSALIERALIAQCAEVLTLRQGAVVIVIVNTTTLEGCRLIPKRVYDDTQKLLHAYAYLHGTVGIGTLETELHQVAQSVQVAFRAQTARLTLGVDRTIDGAVLRYASVSVRDVITATSEGQFVRLIEAFDLSGIAQWIRATYATVFSLRDAPPGLLLEVADEIGSLFAHTVTQLGLDSGAGLAAELTRRLNKVMTAKAIPEEVERFVVKRLDAFLEAKRFQDTRPIRLAKQYIADHYHEAITLEDIAGVVHLNPVYFSVVFKRETDTNFSDYLIQVRLEAAKALLKDTHYNLNQIAERVGYHDPRYFSKLFRRVVGIHPHEYRKLYT